MLAPNITRTASGIITAITIPRPSNFHAHFRWDDMMTAVAPEIMRHLKYVLGMPNNGPGRGGVIRSIEDARLVYRRLIEIRAEYGLRTLTKIILTLYHTADITPSVVERIARSYIVGAIKNYPGHGGTTNSGHGIPFDEHDDTIRAMIEHNVRLLIHAEDVVDLAGNTLAHKDREAHCITHRVRRFREKFPDLLICIEHASTREAIELVRSDTSGKTVMTVTPQHLLFTEDDFERVSWKNHLRCMPYVKTEDDRQALLDFVTSGDPRCIAGDDTAPHVSSKKNGAFEDAMCGCWLPHSIALYTAAFMQRGSLNENFTKFMSYNGPVWWNLAPPADNDTITIRVVDDGIPEPLPVPGLNDVVIPLGWTTEPDKLKLGLAVHL